LKIQIFDGSVEFAKGTIGRRMDRLTFLRSRIGESSKVVVANGPWTTYSIAPETGIAASVSFENDHLRELGVQFRLPLDDANEWSDEAEQERLILHDKWLHAALGKAPYRYTWGQVESSFDPRGGGSEIVLNYAD
jgi:hypothetical protein